MHSYKGKDFATYHVCKKGKQVPLTFQSSWLKDYSWLAYSPSQGGGYCKYCVLFAKPGPRVTLGTLVKTPFKTFSKAKGKDGYLTLHDCAQFHLDAVVAGKDFLANYNRPESRIDNRLDNQRKELSDRNKHILSCIVDDIRLCGMQGLPLRGHRDDSTADPTTNRAIF